MRTKIHAIAEARALALAAGFDPKRVKRMVDRFMTSPEGQADADIVCVDLDPAYGEPDLTALDKRGL
jgi:hypothetical protein